MSMSDDFYGGGFGDHDEILCCSFCGRTQDEVRQLIGSKDALICDECLRLCLDMVDYDLLPQPPRPRQRDNQAEDPAQLLDNLPTPAQLYEELSRYVIGQEAAKKALSVAVYNHYKRIGLEASADAAQADAADDDQVELAKSNILLLGPTGCGKTLLAQTLARILKVPFAIADATTLTEAGYVGEDVENILLKLITAADFDIERAQIGIVYVDEIDKIARKAENLSVTRDVSGEGVQQALLKIIEGTEAAVPPQGGRKHPQQELIHIDTTNILFIFGGAFVGLDKIIGDRVGQTGIGFNSEVRGARDREGSELLQRVLPEDLHKYGMIPEFVGRIPVVCAVEELTEEGLVRILTEPRNALVKQYQRMLGFDGVELRFTDESLRAMAHEAVSHGIGARGLRSICERVLLDTMYELPGRTDVREVVVTARAVNGTSGPDYVLTDGRVVEGAVSAAPDGQDDGASKLDEGLGRPDEAPRGPEGDQAAQVPDEASGEQAAKPKKKGKAPKNET